MTYSHNTTAFALSLTFDLASIRFKVRPFKLLRTPSPHDHLPRLPFFCILCIFKSLQKERLFRTQFFQIFCQLGNADSQRLVPFHMVYWQFLFLSNQRFALLALFLDLLYQTGVTLQLRLPYGKRFLNMRFAAANMRKLITEDQDPAAFFFPVPPQWWGQYERPVRPAS